MAEESAASPTTPIKAPADGDNPNKSKAKTRKNYRPKAKNTVAGSEPKAYGTYIAEPAPTVPPTIGEIDQSNVEVLHGTYSLDIRSVSNMSRPFSQIAIGSSVEYDAPQLGVASLMLAPAAYILAARQMYETFTDYDKSSLQPLKNVYYWRGKLPEQLNLLLGGLGNIKTKMGLIGVANPVHTFLRFVAAAKKIFDDPDSEPEYLASTCEGLVWDVPDFFGVMEPKVQNLLDIFYATTVGVQIGDAAIQVLPAKPGNDLVSYYDYLTVLGVTDQEASVVVRAIGLLRAKSFAFLNHDLSVDLRTRLGVQLADPTLRELSSFVDTFVREYETLNFVHLDRIFKMAEGPTVASGRLSSLVESQHSDRYAESVLPMSDADAYVGFLSAPCSSSSLKPRIRLHAVDTNRTQSFASFATESRKLGRF